MGHYVLTWARRLAHRMLQDAVLTPLGAGRPVDAGVWQRFYSDGRTAEFETSGEMTRYAQVAAYAGHVGRDAAILDVGCGAGHLVGPLRRFGYARYLGIDYAAPAVRAAAALEDASTSFAVADFEDWSVTGTFDVIVFNESLAYARRPAAVLRRFAGHLTGRGMLVVSNYRIGNHRSLWRRIDGHFTTVQSTTVRAADKVWDIRVLRGHARPTQAGP
jgi:2-polyprenyl-3-methyl-5-hydroxy-6-metoxy-1,4-benzoquinol methylase